MGRRLLHRRWVGGTCADSGTSTRAHGAALVSSKDERIGAPGAGHPRRRLDRRCCGGRGGRGGRGGDPRGDRAAKARRWTGRGHWWQRFVWAVEKAESDSARAREVASTTMASLIRMRWSQTDDNEMALKVYDLIVRMDPAPPPSEPEEMRRTRWRRTAR